MCAAQYIVKCVDGASMVAGAFGSATTNHPSLSKANSDSKEDENVSMVNMQLKQDPTLNINFIKMNLNFYQQGIPLATARFYSMGMGIAVNNNTAVAAAVASCVARHY